MNLTALAVKRPVSVLMCVLVLLVFGVSSVLSMEIESTPEMSNPVFMVRTSYPNVGPEEVDQLVTGPVESALSSVSGYTSMTSRSSEGSSMTTLEFDYSADMDEKYQEIQEALNKTRLPDDAGDPSIMQMQMDSESIMTLSIKATGDDNLLAYIEDTIVPELENISGVSSVDVSGGKREYIRVRVREEEMVQYGLTMTSLSSAISSASFTTTAGTISRGEVSMSLMGTASYDTMESLGDIPISLSSGDIIRLSDVAEIETAEQSNTSVSRQNGLSNIRVSISKNQSANTISLCDRLVAAVDRLNAQDLGLTVEVSDNSGQTIMDNIQSVVSSLLIGMVISMCVLFLFLGEPKSAVIVATAMPLSVFAALVLMSIWDMTINMMSLGGLVVGIGMMVDNSIVVMESCFRCRGVERTFEESAREAARLVTSSITASTVTTIVVFLPIALMNGMAGQLFKDVGFTIVFSMSASLLSALTLVPLLFVRLKPVERENTPVARLIRLLERGYVRLLGGALRVKALVVLLAVGLLAGTGYMFNQIDMELMPMMDRGSIQLSVSTKTGLSVEKTDEIMRRVEAVVAQIDDIDTYSLQSRGGSATLSVTLKEDRAVTTDEVVETLREATADIDNCYIEVSKRSAMSFGSSSGVSVSLQGSDLTQLKETAEEARAVMLEIDGVVSASTSLTNGEPRAQIVVDPVQAAAIGLTPSSVLSQVRNMVSGVSAATLREGDREYSVKVEYPADRFHDVSDLSGLLLSASGGARVPLTDIASVVYTNAPSQIQRSDGKYIVTVTAQTAAGASASALSREVMTVLETGLRLPGGMTLSQGSSMRMMQSEFGSIGIALLTAVFLVFVVMSMQFESMKFSVVVMVSIPFALTGAFAALLLTGQSISMTSLIGLVMLVGIVVNSAIVLIDTANRLRREQGLDALEALKAAGRGRLRPILMTTLTTVLSLLPMAIGIGGKVEMMQGMAVVVIGGLAFSTLLTLFLVPTFYQVFDNGAQRRQARRERRALKS